MSYLELSATEIWQLRELTRTAVGRVACRALMVLWRAEGLTTLEIAQRLQCHRETVGLWLERYRTLGLAGLEDEPRSGRPPKLDAPTREQVEAVLEQPPPEADRPCARWTLPHLRTLFQAVVGTTFSLETLRRTVHSLGFRWRRPRWWAHQADPDTFAKELLVECAQQAAKEHAEQAAIAGVAPTRHFCYADASEQSLLAVLRSMWMRRGQQVRVQTPPHNGRWTLFGALNVLTGAFTWQACGQAVTANFLQFLEHLLTTYPTGELLVVVDNASYHTAKATVAWLKAHPRVLLLYLPVRRPDLNPVEPIWNGLKTAVSANRSFSDLVTLGYFIRDHFATLATVDFLQQAGLRKDFCEAT